MENQKISNRNLAGAGIIAALAASACCITPVLVLVAGLSGAASSMSWMEPLRPVFIGITLVVLGFAWYRKFAKRYKIACACENDNKSSFLHTKKFLGLATVLAIMFLAFPYYASALYPEKQTDIIYVDTNNIVEVNIQIEGMTCTVCEAHIDHAVSNVDGVIEVNSNHKTGKAIVKFDKTKSSVDTIVDTINETGYKVIGYDLIGN